MNGIKNRVLDHHFAVQEHIKPFGGEAIFTSLVGSQNYQLDSVDSDIDTYTFIFPSFEDFISGKKLYSSEFKTDDGICTIRDIRLALASLRKSNPNSLEYFATKNMVYNNKYIKILQDYLEDYDILRCMLHANYKQMMDAIAGTARFIHGRNMSAGKRYAHCLRLMEMHFRYFDLNYKPYEYLLMDEQTYAIARAAKFHLSDKTDAHYDLISVNLSDKLYEYAKKFKPDEVMQGYEKMANEFITNFLKELVNTYLQGNGYVYNNI